MELRELEAFVAVATELHFGRAAQQLHMGQPTLSDLVRRLEREVGAALLTRSTRRVALTGAGAEFLKRANVILDEAAAAVAAMHKWADGDTGSVRVGVTPPVAPGFILHLERALQSEAPGVDLLIRRLWTRDLERAVADHTVDVAITCGAALAQSGFISRAVCGEPLMVQLRSDHRLASRATVELADLAEEALGIHSEALFPAWVSAQRQALLTAGISPPVRELSDTDLSAHRWPSQADVDWILTTASLAVPSAEVVIRPVLPTQVVPVVLHWVRGRNRDPAVSRFLRLVLNTDPPQGLVKLVRLPESRAS